MERAERIISFIEAIAPISLQGDTDNSGLQFGELNKSVRVLGVSYEKDPRTITRAIELECDMLVVHRPLYLPKRFKAANTEFFRRIHHLLEASQLVLYAAHENLDSTAGGISDTLADQLAVTVDRRDGPYRFGEIKPTEFGQFVVTVITKLEPQYFFALGDRSKVIRRIGLVAGTAMDIKDIEFSLTNAADCLVCGDPDDFGLRYARDSGLCVITTDDFSLERPGLCELTRRLKTQFPSLDVVFIDGRI